MRVFLGTFKWSLLITAAALVVAYFYGGWAALGLTVILGIMEVTLSFDNAVVNARVLERMSPFWQKLFLTVGLLIAVVGMRLVLPVVLVVATTGLNAADVIRLALERGDPAQAGTFGFFLSEAHPQIAAFGGMFLLMLFLDFIFEDRDITWLSWLEKPLARIGKLDSLSFVVALGALLGASALSTKPAVVLTSGIVGIVVYVLVNGLGALFENAEEGKSAVHLVGKAAFFSFLYLEVLDASFSFDGVIGAFAITADPLIIALGLGVIGALFVRSLTVHLVRQGTLNDYVYLDHGAHWAIGALAGLLLVSINVEVPEAVTGLVGLVIIGAAFVSSVVRNRREATVNA